MTFPQSEPDTMVLPEVQFATGAEGFPVARVGDTAFAMLPGRGDTHFLATAWRVHRPLDELGRNDFYGHGGELAGEEAFRAKVLEQAEHAREELALGRREVRCHGNTPWGPSQGATVSPRDWSAIRPPVMEVSIFPPNATRRSTGGFAGLAAGTRKMPNGRLSHLPFRTSSPALSDGAPSRP